MTSSRRWQPARGWERRSPPRARRRTRSYLHRGAVRAPRIGGGGSFLGYPHPEDPGRTEDKREDQDREDHDVGPGRLEVAVPERADQSDQHAADGRAVNVPDAAEHGSRELEEPRP